MKNVKKGLVFLFLALLLALFTSCGKSDESSSSNESNGDSERANGGELKIAINAQPPSLDPQASTATATRDTARLVFESLLVLNADRKSTRLNSSHVKISYAVFCLKKKILLI